FPGKTNPGSKSTGLIAHNVYSIRYLRDVRRQFPYRYNPDFLLPKYPDKRRNREITGKCQPIVVRRRRGPGHDGQAGLSCPPHAPGPTTARRHCMLPLTIRFAFGASMAGAVRTALKLPPTSPGVAT